MAERKKRSLTKKRRDSIVARDGDDMGLDHYTESKGWHKRRYCRYPNKPCPHLAVHHIKPHGIGGADEPENLITLPSCEHIGICPSQRIKPGYYK